MRVLITGMGGQLGTLVAQQFEAIDEVDVVAGYDLDPPRRRLRRSTFTRISPRDAGSVEKFVAQIDPSVVIHLGLYEPHARLSPKAAAAATRAGTRALGDALERLDNLETVVVRSGIEIYGRRRGGPVLPNEDAAVDPTSAFGRSQLELEDELARIGENPSIDVAVLRFAPVVGSHTPSPLGRLLRSGVVPVPALGEPTFTMLHASDAAAAILAAARGGVRGPVNVVAPGALSALQAARLGGRIPLPLIGPGWSSVARIAEMAGTPLPDHVRELLIRGRCADGARCASALGISPSYSTTQILAEVHDFATVEYLPTTSGAAA